VAEFRGVSGSQTSVLEPEYPGCTLKFELGGTSPLRAQRGAEGDLPPIRRGRLRPEHGLQAAAFRFLGDNGEREIERRGVTKEELAVNRERRVRLERTVIPAKGRQPT